MLYNLGCEDSVKSYLEDVDYKETYIHIKSCVPTGDSGRKRLESTLIAIQFLNYASLLQCLHQAYVMTHHTIATKVTCPKYSFPFY